jgi:hypothetical protein
MTGQARRRCQFTLSGLPPSTGQAAQDMTRSASLLLSHSARRPFFLLAQKPS